MTQIRTGQINNSSESWATWVPTVTGTTLGNGSYVAKFNRVGKTVDFKFIFTLGSTSAITSVPEITLPVASTSDFATFAESLGITNMWDTSASTNFVGTTVWVSTTTARGYVVSGSPATLSGTSSTNPFTWATGDILTMQGRYEVA